MTMTLAELKATIEAEALRRTAARDGFTLEAVESFLGQGVVAPPELRTPVPAPPPAPVPFAYFASLHGRDLVTACYTILLGRGADADGMNHFVDLLARGEDKALVVGSIAYSAEGRQRHARVPGLFPRFAVAASRRVPVLGWLIAWVVALLTLPSQQRHARALEHHLRTRMDALGQYVAQSGAQIAMRIEALRNVMEARD